MEQAPDFYFHKIEQVKMSNWSNNRVVCLGDTAYAPSPLTGAGANLALLGAYVLAGELSKVKDGGDLSAALVACETAFRPFVEEQQQIPLIFPGCAHPGSNFKRWIFNAVMSVLSKIVAIEWVGRMTPKIDDEDFKLPSYPVFTEKSVE